LSKYLENDYTIARTAELLNVSVSTVARAYIRVHENIEDENGMLLFFGVLVVK
jgi:predicted DNA-binding protein YlxM (UPF0122 family)